MSEARSNRPKIFAALALLFLLIVAIFLWPRSEQTSDRADLMALVVAARDGFAAPGRTVEEAASNLDGVEAAFAFVRDQVNLAEYSGSQLDPNQVLVWRLANGADKARLLAAILEAQGEVVRLRTGDWPTGVEPFRPDPLSPAPEAYLELARYLEVDLDAVVASQSEQLRDQVLALRAEVNSIDAYLDERLEATTYQPAPTPAHRVWVEVNEVDRWHVLDPTFPETPVPDGRDYTPEAGAPIQIEILAEHSDGRRASLASWTGGLGDDIALTFQPTTDLVGYLNRAPDPGAVTVWRPVVSANGEAIAGRPFTLTGDALPGEDEAAALAALVEDDADIPAPRFSEFSIIGIDPSAFPTVRAQVQVNADASEHWLSTWFDLTDGGEPVFARVDPSGVSVRPGDHHVALLIDRSASMARAGRIFTARDAAHGVLDGLHPDTGLWISTVADETLSETTTRPLSERRDAREEVDSRLILDGGFQLSSAIDEAIVALGGERRTLVLMGDGALGPLDNVDQIRARLVAADVHVIAVMIAGRETPRRYRDLADEVVIIQPDDDAFAVGQALARDLSAALTLTWRAPEGATAEETREVSLKSAGWSGPPAQADYVVPASTASPSASGLIIKIQIPGSEGTIEREQTLARFRPGEDPWSLLGVTRIGIAPGAAREDAMMAAWLDGWVLVMEAQLAGEGGALPEPRSGPDYWALSRPSSLIGFTSIGLSDELLKVHEAFVVSEHVAPAAAPDGSESMVIARTVSVIHDGGMRPIEDGSARWRTGLALAGAEAASLRAPSLIAALMDADDLIVADEFTPLSGPIAAEPAARAVLDQGGRILTADSFGAAGLVIDPQGDLSFRLFDPDAKGYHAYRTAREFARIRKQLELAGVLASAAGAPIGVSGAGLGAIVGLMDQNMRMYCFASVMLGFVTDEMEGTPTPGGGDAEAWKATALELCQLADPEGLAQQYFAQMGAGFATGWIGDGLAGWGANAATYTFGWQPGWFAGGVHEAGWDFAWGTGLTHAGVGGALSEALGGPTSDNFFETVTPYMASPRP